ncbi:MAG: putative DNA binding domain-containing protein [Acidobacteriia bacterium]|nr:putative DNA binding domain-containing protein [Terriglobia bacterium]
MAITVEQVDEWRACESETQVLEFKEAKNQYDSEKLFSYCIAIANEGGGHLLLGIKNKAPREVVGTAAVNDPIGMADKVLQKLAFRVEVDVVQHPHGRVVVLTIPSRPKGPPLHLEGRYLMRSGESLTAMTPDHLRKIIEEGKPDWLEEFSELGPVDAEQVISLLDTQLYFDRIGLPYPSTRGDVIDRFCAERLIQTSSRDKYLIKRLAAILFAKKMDEFPDIQRKAPRLAVFEGTDRFSIKLNQVGGRGYASGYQGLVKYIMAQLPQNEVIENTLRKKVSLVPEIVMRELVANALIHQDFTVSGASVMVEVYSDRIVISNPGVPVVRLERFIDGYRSRNERLADLMRRMKACEEQGLGIDRVIQNVEVYQLPAPEFRADDTRTIVTIFGPKSFHAMTRDDRVRACFQHCALKYVMNERMTNESLRQRFKLHESQGATASQIISQTVETGLIKTDPSVGGSKKFARYVPFWG